MKNNDQEEFREDEISRRPGELLLLESIDKEEVKRLFGKHYRRVSEFSYNRMGIASGIALSE